MALGADAQTWDSDVSEADFIQIGGINSMFLDSKHWCVQFSLTTVVNLQNLGDNMLIYVSMEGFVALSSGQKKRTWILIII